SAQIIRSNEMLQDASAKVGVVVTISERIIQATASAGIETPDSPYINLVQHLADTVSLRFAEAVRSGEIGMEALFDRQYRPVTGTDPVQMATRFTDFTDRVLPAIQEPAVAGDERIAFCAAIDENGYLPTHNQKFSAPQRP